MNLRNLIVPFILAVATTWAIQYFFFGKKDGTQQYQFAAPQSAVECLPLKKDVDFALPPKLSAATITPIQTSWAHLEFTTDGATLNRFEFKRSIDGKTQLIGTIFPQEREERINRAFLVALPQATPFAYKFEGIKDEGSTIALRYAVSSDQAIIYKTFIVYKKICQIDLKIDVEPLTGAATNIRLFYPAPIMPELKEQEQIAADIMYGTDTFKKIYRDSLSPETYWVNPLLFGVENKYFIHSLITDKNSFVQRAYYTLAGKDGLVAILEGPQVTQPTSWTMSFYVGPKESSAIKLVDERLEQVLDYSGIWAPISRILLTLLNWLNDYMHNYGLAIIVLTILIKLLLAPFSWRAEQGMKDRAEMQKRLQYIQQKYKDDPQARAQAQAEFMRKHGLGLAGCLPLLMQVPIFFGLSRVLSSAIELYKVPFLWMNDLSARDPYYILPILVMLGMISSAFTAADAKQRMPIIAMALAFGAVSASMSAGLVLYIALSTLLNMVQGKLFKWFRLV
jgi:YidC/Oxa1 family membrane protein insertase